jgi:hypothetical protein
MSLPPYVAIDTFRLLVRSVQKWETKEYGTINDMQCNQDYEKTWSNTVKDWKEKGAILLFIILRNG